MKRCKHRKGLAVLAPIAVVLLAAGAIWMLQFVVFKGGTVAVAAVRSANALEELLEGYEAPAAGLRQIGRMLSGGSVQVDMTKDADSANPQTVRLIYDRPAEYAQCTITQNGQEKLQVQVFDATAYVTVPKLGHQTFALDAPDLFSGEDSQEWEALLREVLASLSIHNGASRPLLYAQGQMDASVYRVEFDREALVRYLETCLDSWTDVLDGLGLDERLEQLLDEIRPFLEEVQVEGWVNSEGYLCGVCLTYGERTLSVVLCGENNPWERVEIGWVEDGAFTLVTAIQITRGERTLSVSLRNASGVEFGSAALDANGTLTVSRDGNTYLHLQIGPTADGALLGMAASDFSYRFLFHPAPGGYERVTGHVVELFPGAAEEIEGLIGGLFGS